MPTYKYEIRQSAGGVSSGALDATSLLDATARLRQEGGYLLNVVPITGPASWLARVRGLHLELGPGLRDVQNFTNQLAVMIKAGIPIRNAISGIAEQTTSPRFRRILEQIKHDVEAGQPFSQALARHPKVFSPLYVNMVRASELSGSFGHMLERIAGTLGQQVDTRNMVRGAMVYPAIIACMAVATTIFLLTWVLPRFSAIFAGKEALLPMPTKILLGLSAFLRHRWYLVLGGVVAAVVVFVRTIHTPAGRGAWDRFKLRLPLFRKMLRALYITRGLHTMGELLCAGVPMLETLQITADISGNVVYAGLWTNVHAAVRQGEKVAQPLVHQSVLPSSVVQMISAGEESGKLGEVLQDVAVYYSGELRNTIKAMAAMLEPMMIVIMGLIVGFIAMSIVLPIFKMSALVK
ncbi:MAG: type II secretion system F family protein [Phycisphaerae bacterium]|nr:type II secretion system F family protein [Phycisphaerae bacterium]